MSASVDPALYGYGRSGMPMRQHPDELAAFIDFLTAYSAVKSYVEVGACYGDTFVHVCDAIARTLDENKTLTAVAIDLPGSAWGKPNSAGHLEINVLAAGVNKNVSASLVLGPSNSPVTVAKLRAIQPPPYDVVLIDADHNWNAVLADVATYAPLARYLAFHDIAPNAPSKVHVPHVWRALKTVAAADAANVFEFIAPNSKMGIGVLRTNVE